MALTGLAPLPSPALPSLYLSLFIILPKGIDVHIQQNIHQKYFNLCLHYVTMPRLLLNRKKRKQEIQLCYGAYNETK